MSFVNWIRVTNSYDLSRYVPFRLEGHTLGWVRKDRAELVNSAPEVFQVLPEEITLHPQLKGFDERSAAVAEVLGDWNQEGSLPRWYNELYPVTPSFTSTPYFNIERAAVPFFGLLARGIHVNGVVQDGKNHNDVGGKTISKMYVFPRLSRQSGRRRVALQLNRIRMHGKRVWRRG